ncbi:MAG: hypothetical protein ACQER1_05630 [Armatimonadota bacterium]
MTRAFAVAALCALTVAALAQELPERPYPQGDAFPLGAYSLQPAEEMADVTSFGWNFGHSYQFSTEYLDAALANGLYSLARIPRVNEETSWADVRARIEEYAAYDNVLWWDLPEELRYWVPEEQEMLERIPQLTREIDPQQRPNFMYQPTHVTPGRIANDAPHLDIIGCGGYTEYHHMPRSWIRYAIEREIEGIQRAGFEVGRDYLAGEKTPIAVLQLFYNQSMSIISPIDARHDFWASIAAGARGVMLFSYWHKRDGGVLQGTWEAYAECARQLTEANLGPVILFGEEYEDLSFGIVRGPRMSAPFMPFGYNHEIRYPSLNVRAWTHEGSLYVIAVNSNERSVTARLSGLPEGATEAVALFEEAEAREANPEADQEAVEGEDDGAPAQRTLPITAGTLEDSFGGLGVHIYQVALP